MVRKAAFILLVAFVSSVSVTVLASAQTDTGTKVIAEVEGLR